MRQMTTDQLTGLLGAHESPCISLYQPTHRRHPDNQQDPIRYRNLLGEMESSLREKYPTRQVRTILEKYSALARDNEFWNHRTDGLAVLSSDEKFEIFELQRPVKELLVVADSFHTKPLLRILQSADRFQILCLTRGEAKLYEGNRDALDPVELANVTSTISETLGDQRSQRHQMVGSYGLRTGGGGKALFHGHGSTADEFEVDTTRFFRALDRGILEHHSRASGLPLMLAALPESHDLFRQISHNPFLMTTGILTDPEALSLDQLRMLAWEKVEPHYLARLEVMKENFNVAASRQAGSADLSDVAKAAVAGRVGTLLVEADRVVPGVLDRISGSIGPGELSAPHIDDLLDDLAELVLAKGGEVIVVPKERMPTASGLAAAYRF
jgi:hypothetical protein